MSGSGAMEGGGYYTAHSQPQEAYGELGFEWLEAAAAEAPVDGTLVVADMGAAGGGNSLEPMRRAIAALRERRGDAPVLVVHTDIPANDFSALFELVASSPKTYVTDDVYALAEGRSFYERLFPDAYLTLGWSSIAVHWLSTVPTAIPDHVYCSFATGEARDALREQSARDWRAFLGARAAELRPGGRMVVVGGAALDDGSSGAEGLMDMANRALEGLVSVGILREDEYARMTIPTWNRTTAEFVTPFEGEAVGLDLRRHTLRTLDDAYLAKYREDGDADAYATAVAGFFEAAFEPSLWSALDDARDADDRAALAARFNGRLRTAIAADPEAASCTWHVVVLDIAKPG
jgi:SAM dependent carboxyl methyltransferase